MGAVILLAGTILFGIWFYRSRTAHPGRLRRVDRAWDRASSQGARFIIRF